MSMKDLVAAAAQTEAPPRVDGVERYLELKREAKLIKGELDMLEQTLFPKLSELAGRKPSLVVHGATFVRQAKWTTIREVPAGVPPSELRVEARVKGDPDPAWLAANAKHLSLGFAPRADASPETIAAMEAAGSRRQKPHLRPRND